VISLIDEATTAPTVVDGRPQGDARSATEGRVLDIDDVATGPQADDARRDAIARHPAFAGHDSEAPAVAPSPIPPADDAGADLLRRVERGAARAADEAQLRTLAVRTSHRVVPDGSVTWLAADDAGRLLTWVQTDDAEVPCGVVHASSCPAISTGTTQVVDRSDELDACPHLLGGDQPLSAVACVALPGPSPMVLLARTPAGRPCDDAALRILEHTARVLEARANELSTDA
jgi:hypothetical protein